MNFTNLCTKKVNRDLKQCRQKQWTGAGHRSCTGEQYTLAVHRVITLEQYTVHPAMPTQRLPWYTSVCRPTIGEIYQPQHQLLINISTISSIISSRPEDCCETYSLVTHYTTNNIIIFCERFLAIVQNYCSSVVRHSISFFLRICIYNGS